MPAIVDKSSVTKICVDDFAFRKRYAYGTVMVDLETHRIIDILDSRETGKVEDWLRSYPNLQVISRDGAQAYASAFFPLINEIYPVVFGSNLFPGINIGNL